MMKAAQGRSFRAAISLLVIVSMGFSWLSAQANTAKSDGQETPVSQARPLDGTVLGQLVLKTGDVTINGNEVESGATVLTDSEISTDSDTEAVIDMGPNGRVDLGSRTTVRLRFEGDQLYIKSECGRVEVDVFRGHVHVKEPEVETIVADEDEEYGDSIEAYAPLGSHFRVDCEHRKLIAILPLSLSSLLLLGLRKSGSTDTDVIAPPEGELPPATSNTP
jgi:hypothetical protein